MTTRSALFVDDVRRQAPEGVADAVTAVRALVAASPVPVSGGKAANVARDAGPGIAPGWVGTGSFGGFLAEHLPALRWTSQPGHGYLYDPKQHSATAIVR